ncbi:MAG: type II toxin-antitoxin system HigA family antitoxin [Bacteroidia bacterium]
MELSVIKNKTQYEAYLKWIDEMFDKKTSPKSTNGKKVEVALLLIKQYEDEHYSIPYPDPIETIKLKMTELGLKNKDLVGKFGSKGYVSSLLSGRKPLTLELAKLFHQELHIPAEVFFG